ncbi:MAG TPA: acetyl/propionyl/methylcrotonyl-CoA carboxylase subunit alpha [Bryobacteraceae bacterium]|nr:acetyl/propionyl/methylcrotonyl-CoA carboxylase subunit alpha [Bryobacteraceae bacterium]
MFDKILIANRGEIACRVIRTARHLGVRTVAVYSEADARALHVEMADEAYPIGPAPARESYLSIERILDAARRSGAQAIHPGYGFLAENPGFAEACESAGIVFIGPPASAIRAMGSKSMAKTLMEKSGVPLVPGYHGEAQDLDALGAAANRIGYPVLLKASAGGGGKGMRVVSQPADLASAVASARREAGSSFGDDRLLLEKYLACPRHVEIQVFADTHGSVIYLFDRDCSIQRRYQKIIEEAPAPGLEAAVRRAMGEAACAAARAIGYANAGTVEFLVDHGSFYFMEMNTRLQVEHPVTEFITGEDLVEWQLRVACGGVLPKRQEQLRVHGHAIEARVYAEDPAREFRPSIGTLVHLKAPRQSANVRVDSGVRAGDDISIHYDPMIAKLIVWDVDRITAVQRLQRALAEYEVAGVATNLAFLGRIAAHPAYAAGDLDTGFIPRHAPELLPAAAPASPEVLAAAILRVFADQRREAEGRATPNDPWSPWNSQGAWRMNGSGYQDLAFRDGESKITLRVYPQRNGDLQTELAGKVRNIRSSDAELWVDGIKTQATVVRRGDLLTVIAGGISHELHLIDAFAGGGPEEQSTGSLTAPMPGRITQVLTEPGAEVRRGSALVVLEAMKMEYTITAPADGRIEKIHYGPGDVVNEGAELIGFAPVGAD